MYPNSSSSSNYYATSFGGRSANSSTQVKDFNYGESVYPWKYTKTYNIPVLVPFDEKSNVRIYKNLIVDGLIFGTINTSSDLKLKDNIEDLHESFNDKIMNLLPKKFTYKSDKEENIHYGFIAQELEQEFPHLVKEISSNNQKVKTINYLELIPILLLKIKDLQLQIDELKKDI